jgi:hypothetical protein
LRDPLANGPERRISGSASTRDRLEVVMQTRTHAGWCLVAVLVAAQTITVGAGFSAPPTQSAVAYLSEPTLIGNAFIVGPVLITHDDERMARGGPCTTIHLFDPVTGRATEELTSFHCIPRFGSRVAKLTITTRPSTLGYGCVLTAYQFAGDREIHGVPQRIVESH